MINLLRARCLLQPHDVTRNDPQICIKARIDGVANLCVLMQKIKAAELKAPWTIDISQYYELRTQHEGSRLGKRWRLILRSKDLEDACRQIIRVIQSAPAARVTVDEIPLPGGGAHRAYNSGRGKGVHEVTGGGAGGPSLEYFPRPGGG
ncbi:MAG: hypothetical protein WAN50_04295 [Minisyncoccia bacterium]